MRWLVVIALWCASAWAGGSGGRMGGSSFKSSSSPSRSSSGYSSSSRGSMGGGNWSSPSSSSSSFGSSSSHSWSSSSSSHSWSSSTHWDSTPTHTSTYHYTDSPSSSSSSSPASSSFSSEHDWDTSSGARTAMLVIALVLVGIVLVILLKPAFSSSDFVPTGLVFDPGESSSPNSVDVSVLRVALDGRARKLVQTRLQQIASSVDTSTAEGRAAMLREVTLLLRRLRDAWIYGGAINEPMGTSASAEQRFERHVDAARAKITRETIANVDGVITGSPGEHYVARSDEGAGVILVTIIIAADRELFTVREIGSGTDLSSALEAAGLLDETSLVGVEIIWQPSEDADRLTSIELEALYPHPGLIKIRGALVGKVFCAHCSGPFPAELTSCPHCGAPYRESAWPR